jgi:hypothetical protein
MSRGQAVCAQRPGTVQQQPEFYGRVAGRAGVGGQPGLIGAHKGRDDQFLEFGAQVDQVQGNAKIPAQAAQAFKLVRIVRVHEAGVHAQDPGSGFPDQEQAHEGIGPSAQCDGGVMHVKRAGISGPG